MIVTERYPWYTTPHTTKHFLSMIMLHMFKIKSAEKLLTLFSLAFFLSVKNLRLVCRKILNNYD